MAGTNRRIDWYRVAVAPEQLRALTTPNDAKGLWQAGGHLLLSCMTGLSTVLLSRSSLSWYWLIPVLLAHGTVVSAFGAASHELSHDRVFRTSWLNRVFLNIIGFLTWDNPRLYNLSHNEHHRYTLHQPDDLEVVLPQKATVLQLLLINIFDYKTFFNRVRINVALAFGRPQGEWYTHLIRRADPAQVQGVYQWSRLLLAGHLAVLAVSLLSGLWILPLVVTCGRAYGAGLIMLMGLPQHIGLVDAVNDFRLSCRTYYLAAPLEFLYWHMNYHIEHHMYPAVPCYHLPRLHELIRHELPHSPRGLTETWVQIAGILIQQKYDPTYQYRAPLPTDPGNEPSRSGVNGKKRDSAREVARVWECTWCGFIYDEAKGLPEEGFPPGTRWEDIPDDWVCPICGVAKAQFEMVEIMREVAATKTATAMDAHAKPIVIVGSGLAGYSVAREFRKLNPDWPVTLITRDGGESYYKPALSNALNSGQGADDLVHATAAEMERKLGITLKAQSCVDAFDPAARTITVGGERLEYHKLVLATGAKPVQLALQGERADQVLQVNHLNDYRRFREQLRPGATVVIIGAGLIGCEFANDLVLTGHGVEVIELAEAPLARLVPSGLGRILAFELEKVGVRWHFGEAVAAVEAGKAKALRCRTQSGLQIEGDLVLSAIGLRSNTGLAQAAGLKVNRGIVVDEFMRTSDPDVYAIGDCAEFQGRVAPFVLPIMRAVEPLARTLAGIATPVRYLVMPIELKTPSFPGKFVLPPAGRPGEWHVENRSSGAVGEFHSPEAGLCGFALLGAATDDMKSWLERVEQGATAQAVPESVGVL